jgi:hypothetical protein
MSIIAADASSAVPTNALARFGVALILAGIIFVQRVGIPTAGEFIPITLFTSLLGMGMVATTGIMTLSRWRVELWTVTVAALVVSICFQKYWSLMSFMFLLAAYTPLVVVVVGTNQETYKTYVEPFQWMMVVVSLLGVYQFIHVDQFDPFERLGRWMITGYNTHPPLSYGASLLRSNGYVLLEPSFFSQYCATAILLELTFFRKYWRLPVYAAGMFSAASGSGLIVVMVFVVAYAWRQRMIFHLIIIGVVGLAALWVFSDNQVIQNLIGRTTEIEQPGSSAYGRFVSPFLQLSYQLEDLSAWLVGLGPGSASSARLLLAGASADWAGNIMAPIKMLIEYGMLGAIPFTVFITRAFFDGSRSYVMSFSMLLCYTVMSAQLQHPPTVYLSYVITMMFPRWDGGEVNAQ